MMRMVMKRIINNHDAMKLLMIIIMMTMMMVAHCNQAKDYRSLPITFAVCYYQIKYEASLCDALSPHLCLRSVC